MIEKVETAMTSMELELSKIQVLQLLNQPDSILKNEELEIAKLNQEAQNG